MDRIKKVISQRKYMYLCIFIVIGLFTSMFVSKIKFVGFIVAFCIAIALAFYVEFSTSKSRWMLFIKKYF